MLSKVQERHFRLTPQRVALLRLLARSDGHPSAYHLYERIKEQFPTTSLATVYKTINMLKEMNEVLELGFSDDDNRYDGNKPYPHAHLICKNCRAIVDLDTKLTLDLVREAAQQSGYEITDHRLDFYGLCAVCRAKRAS